MTPMDGAETAAELCLQADEERDFEKLLELAERIQPLIDARRSESFATTTEEREAESL